MTDSPAPQEPWEQPGWLSPEEFKASEGVEDWRVLGDAVYAFFRTDSFATSARLVQAIAELPAVDGDHQPDVDLRHEGVTIRLTTIPADRFFCGHSARDVEIARQISAAARELSIPADPTRVQHIQVSVDALVIPDVMPFWREALGYEFRRDTDEDVVDPRGRGPSFWFQQMDAPRTQRNRIHVDIAVPPEQVETRIAAVLAAGGRQADPDHPWVLSDPEGNEVCLG
ncbi:VOC family protein [Actinopolymorpha pittospori]|uniref:Putative pterin-4-alpha-carbinolamine dehydratase n=1 Tax=Actinopolymorpha pittospori TaxID=648752 RepID=A0A927N4M6_9ACTN|nr:VOC family protein [Actinopolymorpha pittospori]MBE1608470.1 4a-hydroxytetrahydrobiopterin dehydratase [Actinopolymorpha pittospori]